MWFIDVEVEQETCAPPPKKHPGSAPVTQPLSHLIINITSWKMIPNSWKRGNIVLHFKKDLQLEKENLI